MNKTQFVELVQKNGEYPTRVEAEKALKTILSSITEALAQKETISLVGFGTFSTVDVAEKTGKVPGTDKTYTKGAHTAPKFKFGKSVKDAVEGK